MVDARTCCTVRMTHQYASLSCGWVKYILKNMVCRDAPTPLLLKNCQMAPISHIATPLNGQRRRIQSEGTRRTLLYDCVIHNIGIGCQGRRIAHTFQEAVDRVRVEAIDSTGDISNRRTLLAHIRRLIP